MAQDEATVDIERRYQPGGKAKRCLRVDQKGARIEQRPRGILRSIVGHDSTE